MTPTPQDQIEAARLSRLGQDRFTAGQATDAFGAFRLALNLFPADRSLHGALAAIGLPLGVPALALHHAQTVLAADQANMDALIAFAGSARLLGLREEAAKAVAILRTLPPAAEICRMLDLSDAVETGDPEAALFDLAELIAAKPDHKQALELFTLGYRKLSEDPARLAAFLDSVGLPAAPDAGCGTAAPEAPPGSIDIIIPVYNALNDLHLCLQSLRRHHTPAIRRIILIDDQSQDETADWLRAYAAGHGDVVLHRNAVNAGFTQSVVTGLSFSDAPFALLLNSDTIATTGWVDGLWRAVNSHPQAAMAGPFSNHASFQTIRPKAKDPVWDLDIDEAAALVRIESRRRHPPMPFLSGFCVILRRDAYDAAGGLDVAAFPEGYWELQDLALRMADKGYHTVLADDVYVHHSGVKSFTSERSKRLQDRGQAIVFDRYSALRVLTATQVCLHEPALTRARDAWVRHCKVRAEPALPKAALPTPPALACVPLKQPALTGEVCLFAARAPLGTVSDYTLHHIAQLRRAGVAVVLYLSDLAEGMPLDRRIAASVDGLCLRPRVEGAAAVAPMAVWAGMLALWPDLFSADRLIFVSDGLIGPFRPLDPLLAAIRDRGAGFFALSERTDPVHRIEPEFFGWQGDALRSEQTRSFWQEAATLPDPGLALAEQTDPADRQILFGLSAVFATDPALVTGFRPMAQGWQRLLHAGCPFVAAETLADLDPKAWQTACAAHGGDALAVRRHLDQSRLNGLTFGDFAAAPSVPTGNPA